MNNPLNVFGLFYRLFKPVRNKHIIPVLFEQVTVYTAKEIRLFLSSSTLLPTVSENPFLLLKEYVANGSSLMVKPCGSKKVLFMTRRGQQRIAKVVGRDGNTVTLARRGKKAPRFTRYLVTT